MTMLFLNLQITKSVIRPHIKWVVSLVIAYGHFTFLQVLCGYVWVNTLTSLPPEDSHNGMLHNQQRHTCLSCTLYLQLVVNNSSLCWFPWQDYEGWYHGDRVVDLYILGTLYGWVVSNPITILKDPHIRKFINGM